MSKQRQQLLDEALEGITPSTDLIELWRQSFQPNQPDPLVFRNWMRTIREIPDELIPQLAAVQGLPLAEAIRKVWPAFVSLEDLRAEVIKRLAAQAKAEERQAPQPVEGEADVIPIGRGRS